MNCNATASDYNLLPHSQSDQSKVQPNNPIVQQSAAVLTESHWTSFNRFTIRPAFHVASSQCHLFARYIDVQLILFMIPSIFIINTADVLIGFQRDWMNLNDSKESESICRKTAAVYMKRPLPLLSLFLCLSVSSSSSLCLSLSLSLTHTQRTDYKHKK